MTEPDNKVPSAEDFQPGARFRIVADCKVEDECRVDDPESPISLNLPHSQIGKVVIFDGETREWPPYGTLYDVFFEDDYGIRRWVKPGNVVLVEPSADGGQVR